MQTRSGWSRASALTLALGLLGCGEANQVGPVTSAARGPGVVPVADGGATSMVAPNRFGASITVNASGAPLRDPRNLFFRSLGQNGRSCSSCHVPESGMTITPEYVRERFHETDGLDPLFRTVDGASSPVADVSTVDARRVAYGLLLDRALIRVGIGIPSNAEFE